MMLFWVAAFLLVAIALVFVVPPLLHGRVGQAEARELAIAVYRDELKELDTDISTGKLSPESHAEAKRDLECRLLEDIAAAARPGAVIPPGGRLPAILVAVTLPLCAVAIYLYLGSPGAVDSEKIAAAKVQPDPDRQQIARMVEQLAEKLRNNPNDAKGWHMLAVSYQVLERFQNAAEAYARAVALIPDDPHLLAGYAEAVAMTNGRNLSGKPMELLHAALKLDPNHQRSLALAGTAAFNDRDYASAIGYWQRLHKSLPPDSENARKVEAGIMAARAAAQRAEPNQPVGPMPEAPAIAATVSLSPALAAKAAPGDVLFIFAHAMGGSTRPLAVVRAQVKDLPRTFTLNDSMAMTPAMKLSSFPEVMLIARISKSGNAMAHSGDLHGMVGPVKVGSSDVKIVIDSVVP